MTSVTASRLPDSVPLTYHTGVKLSVRRMVADVRFPCEIIPPTLTHALQHLGIAVAVLPGDARDYEYQTVILFVDRAPAHLPDSKTSATHRSSVPCHSIVKFLCITSYHIISYHDYATSSLHPLAKLSQTRTASACLHPSPLRACAEPRAGVSPPRRSPPCMEYIAC